MAANHNFVIKNGLQVLGSTGIYLTDTNTRLHEGSSNVLRITTSTGYVDIGSMNSGWTHFNTDRTGFYFNKFVSIDGNLEPYASGTRNLGSGTKEWNAIYGELGYFSGDLTVGDDLIVSDSITASKVTLTSGTMLKRYESSWSGGATTHDVLYNSWYSTIGDYVYLKASGNNAGPHGIAVVGDNVFAVGSDNLEQGVITNSVTTPITNTWMYVNSSGMKINGHLDLPSAAMIDWANGDARIQEGYTSDGGTNYNLTFRTWNGSAIDTGMRLDGDNTLNLMGDLVFKTGSNNTALHNGGIYYGTATGVENTSWTTAFKILGASGVLDSSIRVHFGGTTGSVVLNCDADIMVGHSQDIWIRTNRLFYTQLAIKVVSDDNENFAVELKTNSTNALTVYMKVEVLSRSTCEFTSSHSYTAETLEHIAYAGFTSSSVNTGGTGKDDFRVKGTAYFDSTDDNSGKADFVVGVGGNPEISLLGNQVQIGSTDMNYTSRWYFSGDNNYFDNWDNNLIISTTGSSGSTNTKDIIFKSMNGSGSSPEIFRIGGAGTVTTTGNHTITGNLTVQGTTTTLETATLNVEDKNITLNYGSGDTSGSANGAGITIQDAVNSSTNATILWDTSDDEFDFSHGITAPSVGVTNIVTNRLVKFDGSILNDSNITDTGSLITLNSNVSIPAGDKLLFGGGNHTYISEDTDDRLRFFTGGAEFMRFTEAATNELLLTQPVHITQGLNVDGVIKIQNNDGGLIFENSGSHGFIPYPVGAYYRQASSTDTGALKIHLPTGAATTDDMISFWVDILQYGNNDQRSLSIYISGYVYQGTGGNTWANESAYALTEDTAQVPINVRFGDDGNNHCVWIGDTDKAWKYPNVVVRDFMGGYSTDIDIWNDGWDITLASAFDTVNATKSISGPVASNLEPNADVDITGHRLTITNNTDALRLYSTTNGAGVNIKFSDQSTRAQDGSLSFFHSDGVSYGSGTAFVFNTNEATHTVLADGKLMFKEGLYLKPSSGTGAGTQIIDSNGYFTGIHKFTKSVYGSENSENYFRIKLQDQGGIHNDVGIGQTQTGNMGFNVTSGQEFIFNLGTSGHAAWIDGNGIDAKVGGFRINGNTVIDSSSNLTNIGTISSGAITATGALVGTSGQFTSLDINGNGDISGHLNFSTNLNGLIRFGSREAFGATSSWLYIDPSADFSSGIYINNSVKVDGGLIGSYNESLQLRTGNDTALTLDYTTQDATFAGNISSGAITATGAGTFTGNVEVGSSGTNTSLTVGGNYGKKYWTRSYAVSNTNIGELENQDGTSLATGGAYRFTGHIDGTGTDQSSRAVFWNENGTWNVNVTGQSGTSSNHIQFLVSGGVPSVKTYHASNYTVRVWHERINLNENAGTDNTEHYFGADAYLSKIGDNLSLNSPTTVPSLNSSGYITSAGTITVTGGNVNLRNNTAGDGSTIRDIGFYTTAAEGTDDRVAIIRAKNQGGASTARGGKFEFITRQKNSGSFNTALTIDNVGDATFAGTVTADGLSTSSGTALVGEGASGGSTQLIYWNGTNAYYGRSNLGGSVTAHEFRSGGATKLTINSSGIDVSGTVTADGLTVSTTYPKIQLNDTTGVDRNFSVGTNNETFTIRNETAGSDSLTIYQDNNVNIPNGSLMVGSTDSPAKTLHVRSSNDAPIRVESTDSTTGIEFKDNNGSNPLFYVGSVNKFYTSSALALGGSTLSGSNTKLQVNGDVRVENSQVLAGRESEATPSHSFHDDSDTGMFNINPNILAFSTAGTERMRVAADGRVTLKQFKFLGGDNTNTSEASEGSHFEYAYAGAGTNITTWYKVCDVVIGTGLYKALSMNITLHSQYTNFGSSAGTQTHEYSASFYRSDGTQDGVNNASLVGFDPDAHELRIIKTSTGNYQLQLKNKVNYRDAFIHIFVTGANLGTVTIAGARVTGSTSGTTYTATAPTSSVTHPQLAVSKFKASTIDATTKIQLTGTLANWSIDNQGVIMDFTRTSASYIRASNASGYLVFQTGGSNNRLQVDSSGINVTGVITTDGMTTSADINFGDNDKAVFGADSDLQIYHDGLNGYINNVGSGSLIIQDTNGSGDIYIRPKSGQTAIAAYNDNAVELGFAGVTKLGTTSTGIVVTGTVAADGLTVDGGATTTLKAGGFTANSETVLELAENRDGSNNLNYGFKFKTDGAGDNNFHLLRHSNSTSGNKALSVGRNSGDISFYENTGTTPKLFWDASAESLGIGTTDPKGSLEIYNTAETSDRDGSATMTMSGQDSIVLYGHGGTNTATYGGITWTDSGSNRRRAMITGVAENADSDFLGLAFYTQGTDGAGDFYESMRISHSGNIGIGTRSPDHKLHVEATNDAAFRLTRTGVRSFRQYINSTGKFVIRDLSATPADRFTIDTSGNVGIGTTAPLTQLHVHGSGQATAELTDAGNKGAILRLCDSNATAGSGGAIVFGDTQSHDAAMGMASIKGYLTNGGTNTIGDIVFANRVLVTDTAHTEHMRIKASGNVGIGTTTPTSTLEIHSSVGTVPDTTNSSLALRDTTALAINNGASIVFSGIYNSSGAHLGSGPYIKAYKLNATSGDYSYGLQFGTRESGVSSQAVGLTITPDQLVGIGTTAPSEKLHIHSGGIYSTPVTYAAYQDNWALKIGASNNAQWDFAGIKLRVTSSGGPRMSLMGPGELEAISIVSDKVGIGTTVPYNKLHVNGTGRINSLIVGDAGATNTPAVALHIKSSATNARLRIEDSDSSNDYWDFYVNQGDGLHFQEDGANRVTFKTGGNVGIGTTAPTATLEVFATNNAAGGIRMSGPALTDATQKVGRIKTAHYTNAEEPFTAILTNAQATTNLVNIGGSSGAENAATQINMYAAADNTTLTGTKIFQANTTSVDLMRATTNIGDGGSNGVLNFDSTALGVIKVNGTDVLQVDSAGNISSGNITVLGGGGGNGQIDVSRTSGAAFRVQAQSALLRVGTSSNHDMQLMTNDTGRWALKNNGSLRPVANNSYDIGSSTLRVATTYSQNFDAGSNYKVGGTTVIDSNRNMSNIGTFSAVTKSFVIDHPSKPGMKLRHGSLEGPENGVYIRGRLNGEKIIELPDYWLDLVDGDSITVNLTPIGPEVCWIEKIEANIVEIGGNLNCFYMVLAERKDVEKMEIEYES